MGGGGGHPGHIINQSMNPRGNNKPPPQVHIINESIVPRVTTTPPHPQYQNNRITNTRRKFTEFTRTLNYKEQRKNTELGRKGLHS